jgi:hypothetical protein
MDMHLNAENTPTALCGAFPTTNRTTIIWEVTCKHCLARLEPVIAMK